MAQSIILASAEGPMIKVSLDDIKKAKKAIQSHTLKTPYLPFSYLGDKTGKEIYLKCEMFQFTGSFKARGATNFMLANLEEAKRVGVVTASAGNHAQGVAWICQKLGVSATIVMPATTPPIKVQNTEKFGAAVELVGEVYDEAFEHAQQLATEKGHLYVPAFRNSQIIAGQGTVGLELIEDPRFIDCEAVVVSVGGGGLMTGVATVLKALRPEIKIYAVGAKNSPAAWKSFKNKKAEPSPVSFTLAEGVANKRPDEQMLAHLIEKVDDMFAVSEESIANAMALLAERGKLVAEGAGALPVSAVLDGLIPEKKVTLILSGGNVDLPALSNSLHRGLVEQGRIVTLDIRISDRPGGLHKLTQVLFEIGANILQVFHQRTTLALGIGETQVEVLLETRGQKHTDATIVALENHGFTVQRIH